MVANAGVAPTTARFDLEDRAFLHYQHFAGDPSRACLVLVHSLAMDHTFWRLVAPALAGQHPILCVDVRGHGQSSKDAGPYTISLFAQDIQQLAAHLGYQKVVIAGASMGGCIALQFAIDYPDMTAGLGLIDTTAWYGETAPLDWSKRGEKAISEGLSSLVDFQATRWFSDDFRAQQPKILEDSIQVFLANDLPAYAATCGAMGNFDGRYGLAQLRMPTAILVGEEDYAAPPEMARQLHQAIAGSTLEIIAGARHLTPLETPERIVATLSRLLGAGQSAPNAAAAS